MSATSSLSRSALGALGLALAAIALLAGLQARAAVGPCTTGSEIVNVTQFYVEVKPASFGGSATDVRIYDGAQWISASNVTTSGGAVTGYFEVRATSVSISKVGIYHTGSGYGDPTQVVIKYANGTVVYNGSISSHTWESGTSYFEYVALPSAVTIEGPTQTLNSTVYTCASYANLSAEPGQAEAVQRSIDEPLSIGHSESGGLLRVIDVSVGYTNGGSVNNVGVWNQTGDNPAGYWQAPVKTVTQTVTRAYTYTTTVTKVTGPNGETTVITQVQTVTLPQPGYAAKRKLLLGAGIAAFLFLLLLAKR